MQSDAYYALDDALLRAHGAPLSAGPGQR
jgi:hypothetical protein